MTKNKPHIAERNIERTSMRLIIILALLGLVVLGLDAMQAHSRSYLLLIGVLIFVSASMLGLRVKRNLILPLTEIRRWADQVRGGNWSARLPSYTNPEVEQLARDLGGIGSLIETLSNKMDVEVAVQTEQLAQKTEALLLAEERARVAGELHDSLAQTLASLRIQVRVLDDTLHQGDKKITWEELEKLQTQVEIANQELRNLIGQFRTPLAEEQVVSTLERVINSFRAESGASVFFQNEWQPDDLIPEHRRDLIRIVQETLANIKKHAKANNVRLLLRHRNNIYRVMIEDDGRGYDPTNLPDGAPGEHLGRQLMQERADNLGARFSLESEVGEGSRMTLEFNRTTD